MAFLHVLRVAFVSLLLLTSVSGHCAHPKVRREWRTISARERADWIKAVNCLSRKPHNPKFYTTVDPTISLIPPINPNSSYYDDFVYAHMDLNVLIHGTGFFLPWHRLYVQTLEDALRSKCGYNGVHPYWDWTQDAANFYDATIFSNSTYDGVGHWGDPDDDYQIHTGGFKNMKVAYPVPHHVRRNFTLQPFLLDIPLPPGAPPVPDPFFMINTSFTAEIVAVTVNSFPGDFVDFHANFEALPGPHPGPHLILGGEMAGTCPFGLGPPGCIPGQRWSPNDPMFFLHHAMIDKIWFDWQHKNASNANAFGGGSISSQVDPSQALTYPTGAPPFLNLSSVIPGDGLWGNVSVQDIMNTTAGKLCYTYA